MVDTMTEVSVGYDTVRLTDHGPTTSACPLLAVAWHQSLDKLPQAQETCRVLRCLPQTAATYSELIDAAIRSPLDPHAIVLIRPDGYVACVAKADDIDAVGDYSESINVRASVVDALEAVARRPATACVRPFRPSSSARATRPSFATKSARSTDRWTLRSSQHSAARAT